MYVREMPVSDHPSTHDLLVRLQSGDIEAAGMLFMLHGKEFYDAARRRALPREDADEAVSLTFVKLLEAVSKRGYNPVRGGGSHWLRSIFNNTVRDIQRRKVPDELTDDLIESVLRSDSDEFDPVRQALDREEQELIGRAIQLLPEAERRELLRERGKRGQKRAALRRAEEHLLAIFYDLRERGFSGDP